MGYRPTASEKTGARAVVDVAPVDACKLLTGRNGRPASILYVIVFTLDSPDVVNIPTGSNGLLQFDYAVDQVELLPCNGSITFLQYDGNEVE